MIIDVNGSTVATDPTNTFAFFNAAVGSFNINFLTATGVGALSYPDLLDVGALDISTTGSGMLTLAFTETDLAAAPAQNFMSEFSATLSKVAVTRSFYLDTTNSGSQSILLASVSGANATLVSLPQLLSGPFSITEVITVQALGAGARLSSDDVISDAPEPGTLSLLAAALLSIAGLFLFRRPAR